MTRNARALAAVLAILASPILARENPAQPKVILATTTSTQDSGLLDKLLPLFGEKTGYQVQPIAVGSGQAMALGTRAEADVLLVHAPDAEVEFMKGGHGVDRKLVMHNDFILVGPSADPARVKGEKSALAALRKIGAAKALFVTRGDNSGTHMAEQKLWKQAGAAPSGESWYQQSGQGMGATLNIASEKNGYTLTDRATYLATKKNLSLVILVEGDASLLNVYHVIAVNPRKSHVINSAGAAAFAEFMVDAGTQRLIGTFGVEKFGQPLFFSDAGKDEASLGK